MTDEQPVFDFSRISYRDSKRMMVIQLEARQVDAQLNDPATMKDGATFQEVVKHLETLITENDRLIAHVLVSVPPSWLVDGAPEELDWSKIESLDWINIQRMNQLKQMVNDSMNPETVSKNSAGR